MAIPTQEALFEGVDFGDGVRVDVLADMVAADLGCFGTPAERYVYVAIPGLHYNAEGGLYTVEPAVPDNYKYKDKVDGLSSGGKIILDGNLVLDYRHAGAPIATYVHENMHQQLRKAGIGFDDETAREGCVEQLTGAVLRRLSTEYRDPNVKRLAISGLDFWYRRQADLEPERAGGYMDAAKSTGGNGGSEGGYGSASGLLFALPKYGERAARGTVNAGLRSYLPFLPQIDSSPNVFALLQKSLEKAWKGAAADENGAAHKEKKAAA